VAAIVPLKNPTKDWPKRKKPAREEKPGRTRRSIKRKWARDRWVCRQWNMKKGRKGLRGKGLSYAETDQIMQKSWNGVLGNCGRSVASCLKEEVKKKKNQNVSSELPSDSTRQSESVFWGGRGSRATFKLGVDCGSSKKEGKTLK